MLLLNESRFAPDTHRATAGAGGLMSSSMISPSSRLPRLAALALALSVGLTACEEGPAAVPPAVIDVDRERVVTARIGQGGGSVTATGADGVTYHLEVPPLALQETVDISVAPVRNHRDIPLSGGFAGGVVLEPAGLQFLAPAQLTITGLAPAPAGMLVVGLHHRGDGTEPNVERSRREDGTVSFFVPHFSGMSVGFGTTADVLELAQSEFIGDPASQDFIDELNLIERNDPAAANILKEWFDAVVLPTWENVSNDATLLLALGEAIAWDMRGRQILFDSIQIGGLGEPAMPEIEAEYRQLQQLMAQGFRDAIDGNNARCTAERSVQAMQNVLFYSGWAQAFGLAGVDASLGAADILDGLCMEVRAVNVSLADPLPLNEDRSLDIEWALVLKEDLTELAGEFVVSIGGQNVSANPGGGLTGPHPGGEPAQGFFTTVVRAPSPGAVKIDATACWIPDTSVTGEPGLPATSSICTTTTIRRNGGLPVDIAGAYNGTHFNSETGIRSSPVILWILRDGPQYIIRGGSVFELETPPAVECPPPGRPAMSCMPSFTVEDMESGIHATATEVVDQAGSTNTFTWVGTFTPILGPDGEPTFDFFLRMDEIYEGTGSNDGQASFETFSGRRYFPLP